MTFHIQKVMVMEGKDSLVGRGEQYRGRELRLWRWNTEEVETVKSLSQLRPDWQIIITDPDGTYLRTSMIDEILKQEVDEVVFKTQTSIYRIREV